MSSTINHRLPKKMGLSLITSWLVPWVLYLLVRNFVANDATSLAIVGVIPAVRAITQWVWRRRVDWISAVGALSFAIALVVSILSGGSSLPFKLYHPVLTGTLGLAFLISAAFKKPLLLTLVKTFKQGDIEQFNNPSRHKKITLFTAVIGLVLISDAGIHIIMAINLPTSTFLLLSRIVTIAMVPILVGVRWIVQRP